jgi:hypothetical protein
MPTSDLNFGSDPSLSLLSCFIDVSMLLESVVKLSPCVIGVAASGLELGEPFRPETFTTQHWATVRSHGRSPLPRLELCVQVGTVSSDVLCGSQGFFAWASPQRALRCETWWGLRTTEYFESIKIFQSSSKRIEPCKPKPLEPLFFEIRT